MRIVLVLIAILVIGVSAARRGAPSSQVDAAPRRSRVSSVLGGAHFGWGLDELTNDHVNEEVKEGTRLWRVASYDA